jgi:hypothetical protein
MTDFISTPLEGIPTIAKLLRHTFHSGKTKDISFRKEQLKKFWKLIDVRILLYSESVICNVRS